MVLGAAAKEVHFVYRKGHHYSDPLCNILGYDLLDPRGAGNGRFAGRWLCDHSRPACMVLPGRNALCSMELRLSVRYSQASSDRTPLTSWFRWFGILDLPRTGSHLRRRFAMARPGLYRGRAVARRAKAVRGDRFDDTTLPNRESNSEFGHSNQPEAKPRGSSLKSFRYARKTIHSSTSSAGAALGRSGALKQALNLHFADSQKHLQKAEKI